MTVRLPAVGAPRNRLLVLGYHNVSSTWRFPVRGDATSRFARQLRALGRVATVVPLDSAVRTVLAGGTLPPRAVALTFDDGYRDNLTLGAPVLARLGLPASVFLVPGFLSGRAGAWWERLAWALARSRRDRFDVGERRFEFGVPGQREALRAVLEGRLKGLDHRVRLAEVDALATQLDPAGSDPVADLFLDWDGARDLVRAGLTIGSHTMEHAILARETAAEQRADLAESRRVLERELAVEINSVAYPNGTAVDYDNDTVAAAKHAGYTHAVTTTDALVGADTPPFEICRRVIDPMFPANRLAAAVVRDYARAMRQSSA
jgi:peptidoglycan/xylan/chitin deacetylase (PgdA/CDA1 family)